MFTVYILKSQKRNYLYVGMTNDIERRVSEHNRGKEKTTRPHAPFDLIHTDIYAARAEARIREKYLKSGCGKEWIKKQLLH